MKKPKLNLSNYEVILGPPGTGKTTHLLKQIDTLLLEYPLNKILFSSFTRAAVEEATSRISKADPEHLLYFRTIHSLCYRLGTTPDIVTNNNMIEFSKIVGIPITFKHPKREEQLVNLFEGDYYLWLYGLQRASLRYDKKSTLLFISEANEHIHRPVNQLKYSHFVESYEKFKKDRGGLQDYTDILLSYIGNGEEPDINAAIIDEAQDLTYLQWKVVEKLTRKAKKLYIAGDDDQAIFSWSGAEPDILVNTLVEGPRRNLVQSYRLPENIKTFADRIIRKIPKENRIEKWFHPTKKKGRVVENMDSDAFRAKITATTKNEKDETSVILIRNKRFGEFFEEKLNMFGMPTYHEDSESLLEAMRLWAILDSGGSIGKYELLVLYHNLKRTAVAYGFKKKVLTYTGEQTEFDVLSLIADFGLLKEPGDDLNTVFDMNNTNPVMVQAFQKGIRPILITTIHKSKGREWDNVFLFMGMTRRTFASYKKNPEAEHRVFYVGASRAKKYLGIIEANAKMRYDYT